VLAALVRAYGAWTFLFEQDELYTIDEATNLFHTKLLPGIQARPVFFLLEHPVTAWLPHTPIVLRALPLIVGILGVWVTWRLGRRLVGEVAGGAAALLAALSPWHVAASGFGRYYSFLYLFAALAYLTIPAAMDRETPRRYLQALVVLLIGAWTHPSFVFPVAGAIVGAMLVTEGGTIRWQWPSRMAWTYLWGPFLGISALGVATIRVFSHNGGVANGGDRGLAATLRLVPAMVDWMTLVVFAAAGLGTIALLRSRAAGWRRSGTMALLGVTGMLVALFVLSFRTAIYADYGISALPLVFLAAGGLVQWAAGNSEAGRRLSVAAALTAVIVVGALPSLVSHLSDGTRFDYRPAYERIAREAPQTSVLTWPIVLQRWYAPELHGIELPSRQPRLDSLLTQNRDLWVVTSVKRYGIVGDDTGEMAAWLDTRCRHLGDYQRPRLDYRMYRVDVWRCTLGS